MSRYEGIYTFDIDSHKFTPLGNVEGIIDCSKFNHGELRNDTKKEPEERRMKEENILLPGEARFTDEEFTLMKMLLADHLVKVQTVIQKLNHLQREENE